MALSFTSFLLVQDEKNTPKMITRVAEFNLIMTDVVELVARF